MDRPQPVSAELEADLESLRKINRHFGSYTLVRKFFRRWLVPGRTYRILDLATGSGDIPRLIVDMARTRGIGVRIDAVDFQPATLEIARRWSRDYPEISFVRGDIRTYDDELTYDIVYCSLALHHFSDEDAAKVLRRARTLSHDKVLVADLERTWITRFGVKLITTLFFRAPMTRHDATVSVQRAFSFRELEALAEAAGWESFGHRRFFPARQAIWMEMRQIAPAIDLGGTALDFAT